MAKRGWLYDIANSRGGIWIDGTEIVRIDDATNNIQILGTAGMTIDAGGLVVTAGDAAVTAGNLRLGAIETFGTTEPTSWVVFKSGTQPAGAITTSGGVGADDTTVQKIIAAGTINNVET